MKQSIKLWHQKWKNLRFSNSDPKAIKETVWDLLTSYAIAFSILFLTGMDQAALFPFSVIFGFGLWMLLKNER